MAYGLTCLIGGENILDGQLGVVKFSPQTIPGKISTLEDVDRSRLSYISHVVCVKCIGAWRWSRWSVLEGDKVVFHSSVYFHPNVRVDGWSMLQKSHAKTEEEWVSQRPDYQANGFPRFPSEPRFWDLPRTGSDTFFWPPLLFHDWASDVSRGIVLTLDDAPGNLSGRSAGPIIPSNLSSPLSTPPNSPSLPPLEGSPIAGPSNHATALDRPLDTDRALLEQVLAEQSTIEESLRGITIDASKVRDESFGNFGITDAEMAEINMEDYLVD